ncbi:28S ribosomal protein S31, mitochondrial [Coregonus clupeaformis]|uniref:28S ribosomal protein S31, mitochondrial n=1 Tax=Coregonus clupeaformis TaxID=59861 RepID=UPI001BE0E250|nr:28S ribosomal protein S31, mitochondrial [Coregonus clupeaformis]
MYRRLLLSVYQARNRALHVYIREACLRSSKCDIVLLPIYRATNGGVFNAFGTSSATYCGKKEGPLPPKEENSTVKDGEQKEAIKMVGEKVIELQDCVKMVAEQREQRVGVKMEAVKESEKIEEILIQTEEVEPRLEAKMDGGTESVKINEIHMKTEEVEQKLQSKMEAAKESEKIEEIIQIKTEEVEPILEAKMEAVKESKIIEEIPVNMEAAKDSEKMEEIQTKTEPVPIPEVKMEGVKESEEMEEIMIASKTEEQKLEVTMEVVKEGETIVEVHVKTEVVEGKKEGDKVIEEQTLEVNKEEQQTEVPPKEEIQPVKTGKENLLDLLGAMKVEVTNKRKFKALKVQRVSEPAARPKPAAMESTTSMFQEATGMADAHAPSETLSLELVAAVSAAASTLPNQSQAESELLKKLRQHEAVGEAQKNGDVNNIGFIIADMKVGKRPNGRQNARPANQIRFDEDGRGYTHDRGITAELDGGLRRRRSLFSGKRLNIFTPSTEPEADTDIAAPTLWDMELANQVALSTNQMPRNGFEEMIQWTKEGRLWQYPINNEAGLEEEALVPFHEHVFLEKHLEEGFPRQGPVRHFMELVVSGLAKNPYYTVQQKREHIAWFRDYFQQKEEVLKEAEVYLN